LATPIGVIEQPTRDVAAAAINRPPLSSSEFILVIDASSTRGSPDVRRPRQIVT
jgi:hypothetical protein